MTEVHGRTETGSASAGDQAKGKAQEAVGQAQDKAQEAVGQTKNRVAVEIDDRSTQVGEQLRSTAGDARSVAEELRKQGKAKPAQLADRAAEQAERLGGYLHDSDGQRILRDVEDFGRSKPWALATGGLVLGFAASRLLKASSSRRYETSSSNGAASLTAPAEPAARPQQLPAGVATPSGGPLASPPGPPARSTSPGAV
jgi:uncharacterized protein YjbJ (UPF0337 family)